MRLSAREYEALQSVWCLAEEPNNIAAAKEVLNVPLQIIFALRCKGAIANLSPPTLTTLGRGMLRVWRTCIDCKEECVKTIHDCTAKKKPTHPYRNYEH